MDQRTRGYVHRMEDIPGLVICHVCDRRGPGFDELIALPDELEAEALRAGWRYDEENRWTCWTCLGDPSSVQ